MSAFGVGHDDGIWVFIFDLLDRFTGKFNVDVAGTLPEIHFSSGLFDNPLAEVGIWDKKDGAISWCLIDDMGGIAGGADDVAECFDSSRAVDVGDDIVVFVCVFF